MVNPVNVAVAVMTAASTTNGYHLASALIFITSAINFVIWAWISSLLMSVLSVIFLSV